MYPPFYPAICGDCADNHWEMKTPNDLKNIFKVALKLFIIINVNVSSEI